MYVLVKKLIRRACAHLKITIEQLQLIEQHSITVEDSPQRQAQVFSIVCRAIELKPSLIAQLDQGITSDFDLRADNRYEHDTRYFTLFYVIRFCHREPLDKFFEPKPWASLPTGLADPSDSQRQELAKLFGDSKPVEPVVPKALSVKTSTPWDPEQNNAFNQVRQWLSSRDRPVYRLFGYAGTGKTTMANHIADMVRENGGTVLFASFGGKAAAVMRSKGCTDASTIHSLIYRPQRDSITGKVVGQTLNRESPLISASLLIIDEVSMVNTEMATDLLTFGVPILVLGDPGQLKPIKGHGYFMEARPDTLLTKVHRNAEDSPIIYLATRVRKGRILKPGRYGDSRVLAHDSEIKDSYLERADVVLCGMNRTRQSFNRRIRKLNGRFDRDSVFPVKGDRLMCLKNNKEQSLFNGTLWTCGQPEHRSIYALEDPKKPQGKTYDTNLPGLFFRVRSTDMVDAQGNLLIVNTSCSAHLFDTNLHEPHWRAVAGCDQWDFGYAFTAHKAQGSQWDRTLILDESFVFEDQKTEHLYTALTRAAESTILRLGQ